MSDEGEWEEKAWNRLICVCVRGLIYLLPVSFTETAKAFSHFWNIINFFRSV